jgi:hypothetical protein
MYKDFFQYRLRSGPFSQTITSILAYLTEIFPQLISHETLRLVLSKSVAYFKNPEGKRFSL